MSDANLGRMTVARLLCGMPTNGVDLATLPEPWRSLAARLIVLPPDQRSQVFRRVAAERRDLTRIAEQLFETDPTTGESSNVQRSTFNDKPETLNVERSTLNAIRWDPPVPFVTRPVPPFPTRVLPGWLREFVEALSLELQTPPDLAGCLALAALSVAVAGRYEVNPWGDWHEPVNLYLQVVLPSGAGKSPAVGAICRPILDFEEAAGRCAAPAIAEAADLKRVAEQTLQRARDAAARASDEDRPTQLAEVSRRSAEAQAIRVPAAPRLLTDDCSPEKLASLLHEHGGRIAVLSPEGGIFDLMAGRYSQGGMPNLDHFLKGHAGDPIIVDRTGRPSEFVRRPALTLGLSVQPDVLRGMMGRPGFHGRGLLARFLYSVPVSLVGRRDYDADPPAIPPAVRAAFQAGLTALLIDSFNVQCSTFKEDGAPTLNVERSTLNAPVVLPLAEMAALHLKRMRKELEPRLGEFGDLARLVDWGSKLIGAVARLAALLHLADTVHDPARRPGPIDERTMVRAIELGRYFTEHARAAYDAMGQDPAVDDAKSVLRWLRKTDCRQISKRDLMRGLQSRFRCVEDIDPAIRVLEKHGYLRRRAGDERPRGGRPSGPVFDVSPYVHQTDEEAGVAAAPPGGFVSSVSFVTGGRGAVDTPV